MPLFVSGVLGSSFKISGAISRWNAWKGRFRHFERSMTQTIDLPPTLYILFDAIGNPVMVQKNQIYSQFFEYSSVIEFLEGIFDAQSTARPRRKTIRRSLSASVCESCAYARACACVGVWCVRMRASVTKSMWAFCGECVLVCARALNVPDFGSADDKLLDDDFQKKSVRSKLPLTLNREWWSNDYQCVRLC